MAIRVQCDRCTKRISIDEAFAGGVCRCPYCTAINNVPKHGAQHHRTGQTPAAGRSAQAAKTSGKIPVANRVMFQGLNILFLVLAIGVLVGGGIFMIVMLGGGGSGENGNGQDPLPTNPFLVPSTPTVAGNVPIKTPVVYVLDTSGSMGSGFPYSARMVRVSLESLPNGSQAAVIVSGEEQAESTGSSFLTMPGGRSTAASLLGGVSTYGSGDLVRALQKAISMRPATVVVFARKYVDDAYGLADNANADGIRIVTVLPGGHGDVAESMAELAKRADGESRIFSLDQLAKWADDAPGN